MNIIAASIVKNMELFIESMITSVSWVDQIVIYNDHSTDKTTKILSSLSKKPKLPYIIQIEPFFNHSMMNYLPSGIRDLNREMKVRNTFLEFVFSNFNPDAVLLIDGDELISVQLKPFIENVVKSSHYNSIAITCNHVLDKNYYLHVYEANWNSILMVDPHVRILTKFQKYQKGEYKNVPDCFLKPTQQTLCLDGAFHYHLKYTSGLKQQNYSFRFLPKSLDSQMIENYIKKHRFPFPGDLKYLIDRYLN